MFKFGTREFRYRKRKIEENYFISKDGNITRKIEEIHGWWIFKKRELVMHGRIYWDEIPNELVQGRTKEDMAAIAAKMAAAA